MYAVGAVRVRLPRPRRAASPLVFALPCRKNHAPALRTAITRRAGAGARSSLDVRRPSTPPRRTATGWIFLLPKSKIKRVKSQHKTPTEKGAHRSPCHASATQNYRKTRATTREEGRKKDGACRSSHSPTRNRGGGRGEGSTTTFLDGGGRLLSRLHRGRRRDLAHLGEHAVGRVHAVAPTEGVELGLFGLLGGGLSKGESQGQGQGRA